METVEEPPISNSAELGVKNNTSDEAMMNATSVETNVCHTSNGVAESEDVDLHNEQVTEAVGKTTGDDVNELVTKSEEDYENFDSNVTATTETEVAEVSSAETGNSVSSSEVVESEIATEIHEAESIEVENEKDNTLIETEVVEESIVEDSVVEVDGIVDNSAGNITFETEIFIENNTAELYGETNTETCDEPDSSNVLSELGQNIELSDVLRSSDVSEMVENNNCEQEVFNKEELLDILEGNDIEQSRKMISENFHADSKKLEEHLAIQQLSRLKGPESRKRNRHSPRKQEKKQPKRTASSASLKEAGTIVDETTSSQIDPQDGKEKVDDTSGSLITPTEVKEKVDDKSSSQTHSKVSKSKADVKPKQESIVNALVQDWSDDEPMEPGESDTILEESEALLESTEEIAKSQESVVQEGDIQNESQVDLSAANNADASTSDELTLNNKSGDEAQPQRRLGRVIKKKVIFDPDNPDTFTKTKVHIKKEKDVLSEKEQSSQSTPKKLKSDQSHIPKTKSPVAKMQWKKPQPKNNKQSSKRLTEIDKLLMDEGAVNMICQLTPEALKGNKNMKSKAEFIKNIQSNTPDKKEMKFRERKNKFKSEGDSKKLGSAKNRLSLISSVKSPAVSEDFENHSADDSIIYRRHSSSSYSSSCMSPRRLSDVEGGLSIQNATQNASQMVTQETQDESLVGKIHDSNIFMAEKTSTPRRDSLMNKSDCLSIKEKLNSKLSQALNKRKLSSFKTEKPSKVKKIMQIEEVSTDVTVNFNQNVAEICIQKAGSLFNIQIMKVLENILSLVDSNKDIKVTLITSESGTVCSGLDLKPILEDVKHAHEIADHARSLLHTLEQHSKLVLVGVEGKTHGFSLALAALSDVLLAGENATFTLAEKRHAVLHPGAGVITSRALPQNVLKELIVFGRELSAAEALRDGLVSRVIWPERFYEQVRAIAQDIAAQPFHNIMLKKRLLSLNKGSDSTFQTSLEKERDLLVNYWTSAEGMELLRTNLSAV